MPSLHPGHLQPISVLNVMNEGNPFGTYQPRRHLSVNTSYPVHPPNTNCTSGPELTSSTAWYAGLCSFAHQHWGSQTCDQGKFNVEYSTTVPSGAISVTEWVSFGLPSEKRVRTCQEEVISWVKAQGDKETWESTQFLAWKKAKQWVVWRQRFWRLQLKVWVRAEPKRSSPVCQGKELGLYPTVMGSHWELSDRGVTWTLRGLPLGHWEGRLSGERLEARRQVRRSFIALFV